MYVWKDYKTMVIWYYCTMWYNKFTSNLCCMYEKIVSKTVKLVADIVWVCMEIDTFLQRLILVCSIWSSSSTTGPCLSWLAMYRAVAPSCIYVCNHIWLCIFVTPGYNTTWHSSSVGHVHPWSDIVLIATQLLTCTCFNTKFEFIYLSG